MDLSAFIAQYQDCPDLHVTRIMGCLVAVSEGRAIGIDRAGALSYCPLQAMLSDAEVEAYVAEKVAAFGHFTARREICRCHHGVPFGASEMMMAALRQGAIDCAITVCDGAGSVISAAPEVVQGVGARMNGLFYTTPIPAVTAGLRAAGAIVFDDGRIDQVRALSQALDAGYRRLMVTVNGFWGEAYAQLRRAAAAAGAELILAAVCNTGVSPARADEIAAHADLIWSCASRHLREHGARARLQLTCGIPVFVATAAGLEVLAAYSDAAGAEALRALDPAEQYLLAGGSEGVRLRLGERVLTLRPAPLPVGSRHAPRPLR